MSGSQVERGGIQPPLRVAIVTGNFNYVRDGVALTLNRAADHLAAREVPVMVVAPTTVSPVVETNHRVVSVPSVPIPLRMEYRAAMGLSVAAKQALLDFRPTIVHVATPDMLGKQAIRFAKSHNIPVLASYHTRYDAYAHHYGISILRGLWKRHSRKLYNGCDCILAPSESMANLLRQDGILAPIHLWKRGVDRNLFTPERRKPGWRRKRGIGEEEVLITFVGRLVREKNVLLLEEIFSGLREKGLEFRTMIVGNGPLETRLRDSLRDSTFTGFLTGPELANCYANSGIFLFPSESESFGNVTLEAMASGVPVVAANACGSMSLVQEGTTGFLADEARIGEFVAHLAKLIDDPELRRHMGDAGHARSMSYDWTKAMYDLENFYRRTVEMFDEVGR